MAVSVDTVYQTVFEYIKQRATWVRYASRV